jgi:hypothetical protein
MEIPDLNELVAKYKGNEKVVFVAVALDYAADLKDFLSRIPFNYTIIDNGKFIADNYRVKSFPTHLIVSPEGKVYYHSTGLGMNSIYWLKKSIDELLNEQGKTAAN